VNELVVVSFAESVNVTENGTVPDAGGVPVRRPLVLKFNQVGSPVAVHV
jgi:hypothetical protein